MTEPVKKRAYSSGVRQEQAARTRERIVEAAAARFAANGYARTSMREIAEAAEVAGDTVYAVFGSKARVLTAIIDARLASKPSEQNVMDGPAMQAVRDARDPREQIELLAREIARLSERVRPVYEIMRTASAVEPEMAAVFAEMERYRLRNMTQAAQWIGARVALRMDADRAGEVIWAIAAPDVARSLCDTRGWTQDQYADWLADTLFRSLVDAAD